MPKTNATAYLSSQRQQAKYETENNNGGSLLRRRVNGLLYHEKPDKYVYGNYVTQSFKSCFIETSNQNRIYFLTLKRICLVCITIFFLFFLNILRCIFRYALSSYDPNISSAASPVSYIVRIFGFLSRLLFLSSNSQSNGVVPPRNLVNDQLRNNGNNANVAALPPVASSNTVRRRQTRCGHDDLPGADIPLEPPLSRAAAYVSSLSWPPALNGGGAAADSDDDESGGSTGQQSTADHGAASFPG